ncbi:hypothetical protein ACXYMO_14060 [Arenibacterium sp. CAU 1754]
MTSALPALPGADLVHDMVQAVSFEDEPLAAPNDPVTPQLGCEVTATATPAPMASVDLSVVAPCQGNERLTIHHTGMMFTETTNADGRLAVTIPALSEDAIFVVEFENGKGAVAMAHVPSLAEFDRIALQWNGHSGFQVHAREFGASYGDKGHVWSGNSEAASDIASGGVVTRLGDGETLIPRLAEVYTYPTGTTKQTGVVTLTIEAEVTQANCGRDIAAQAIELRHDKKLRTQDLVLAMPNCGAVGDFLVLNNLVDDLKIASK